MLNTKPVSRKSDIVVQDFDNEILIYDLTENKAFSLNQTSAMVWQLCDGTRTVSDIAKNMSGRLDSIVTEDFVWLALEQLKRDNLLENSSDISIPFAGLSRRDVIRKVGLASMIALPIISSLVAPLAINAASGNCTAGSQCPAPISCCSNIPGQPRTCVTTRTPTGGVCGLQCECVGSCCVSGICSSNTVGLNSACTSSCQCQSSRTCTGGFCV